MYRFAAPLLIMLAALPAFAADRKFDADAKAEAIAPFIDEGTFGVLHVDLDALDVEALLTKAETVAKIEAADKARFKAAMSSALDALKKAGAHDYYLVISLTDLPNNGPFSVIPIAPNGNKKAVAEVVKKMQLHDIGASDELHGAVVVGANSTIKRLAKQTPTPRPEIAKAFAALGDGTGHFVLFATPDARKVLEETLPKLPKEIGLGDTSVKVLTRGLQWVGLKVQTDPKVSVEMLVQASDKDAAKELSDLYAKVLLAATTAKEMQEILKDFPKLAPMLTPKVEDDRLVLKLDEKSLIENVKPAVVKVQEAAFRMESSNNLKQLVLALHNYHDTTKAFPAQANFSKDGKPLLSWRVHILPYIEQQALYNEFHLDEPWDSEHNIKLVKKMPKIFISSKDPKLAEAGKTTYVGIVDKATMFTGDKTGVRIADVTDGTSNTIFIVDADDEHAVVWTKPEDLKLDPKEPHKGISSRFPQGFLAAFVDGSVRIVSSKVSKEALNALFTRNGNDVPGPDAPQ